MSEFSTIVYAVDEHIARITLNRVDLRNAQDKTMLYELNDAFDLAAQDDGEKVIVLDANGPHFSRGHDLADQTTMADFQPVSNWGGYALAGSLSTIHRHNNNNTVWLHSCPCLRRETTALPKIERTF
mgnify:CR=1 FL=1